MAEELQHLIDRIQKEAVDTAEKQSEQLIAQAKQKAAAMVKEAEEKARTTLEKADNDAKAYTERSIKTLNQAARDLLITVGQGIENVLADIVDETVEQALTIDAMKEMLVKVVEAYVAKGGTESRLEVLVSQKDQQEIVRFFESRYRQKLGQGLQLRAENEVFKGFKVSFAGGRVYHDFTKEAIAESLTNFLRPHLAEIVHRVAHENSGKKG